MNMFYIESSLLPLSYFPLDYTGFPLFLLYFISRILFPLLHLHCCPKYTYNFLHLETDVWFTILNRKSWINIICTRSWLMFKSWNHQLHLNTST